VAISVQADDGLLLTTSSTVMFPPPRDEKALAVGAFLAAFAIHPTISAETWSGGQVLQTEKEKAGAPSPLICRMTFETESDAEVRMLLGSENLGL
jgi:hypothetical protein